VASTGGDAPIVRIRVDNLEKWTCHIVLLCSSIITEGRVRIEGVCNLEKQWALAGSVQPFLDRLAPKRHRLGEFLATKFERLSVSYHKA